LLSRCIQPLSFVSYAFTWSLGGSLFLIEQGLGTISESVCTNRHGLSFCINDHFQVECTLGTGTVLAIGTCHGHWRSAGART